MTSFYLTLNVIRVAFERVYQVAVARIPDLNRVILKCARQHANARQPHERVHVSVVLVNHMHTLGPPHAPHPNRAVPRAASQSIRVAEYGKCVDAVRVTVQCSLTLATRHVPNFDCFIERPAYIFI